jgi:hypothetical protein
MMQIEINPKKIAQKFVYVTLMLVAAHIAAQILLLNTGDETLRKIASLFHLDEERNFPTYYSSILLFISAVLLYLISFNPGNSSRDRSYWIGLSCVFLFISIDELIEIHERFGNTIQRALDTTGIFFFAWVIPYSLFLLLLTALYLKFLLRLPKKIFRIFLISAIVYITGALFLEMAGSYLYVENLETKTLTFYIFSAVEEILEISGLIIFIYGLLLHLSNQSGEIKLNFNKISN